MTPANPRHLTASSHAAYLSWRDAGVRRRLAILSEAGELLSQRSDELYQGLYADGLSQRLARYYGRWILHNASPALLGRYADELTRRVKAGTGEELLVRRPDGVVLMIAPGNSPTVNCAPLFPILLVVYTRLARSEVAAR